MWGVIITVIVLWVAMVIFALSAFKVGGDSDE